MQVRSLGREDPLEKETAARCSTLAWRIPWTEDPADRSMWSHTELDTTENSRARLGGIGATVRSGHLPGGQSVPCCA